VGCSWTTNHNKVAVPGLVSQPITAYVSHLTWQLSVTTLAAASGTPVLLQQATADNKIGNQRLFGSQRILNTSQCLHPYWI